ncbi:hypothetical protein TRFO_27894 [Tritrichomonas foetus]|uniref:Peptidase C39-like domain-containing protein n=1 Tax=Tritrichomonas foetus TaxID=1144522 RepID=A0A1J4K4G1_9EUKA|nr:hypothetical protein TRFO_27894 [Tritrichomonas foetus]|eukprot:OHT04574.1 hypothetical protein TRFO_27894 [Tritrichomonas foetus]
MGRTKNRSNYKRYDINIDELQQWPYHLSKSTLQIGQHYPEQDDTWDCGPNSSGRALQMWYKNPKDFIDYSWFKNHCPKTLGSPQTPAGKTKQVICGILSFYLSVIVTKSLPDVGPSPRELADYISDNIKGIGRGIFSGKQSFSTILKEIKDDLNAGDPVIALIAWDPFSMHYVNVVGISDENDIAILDTDNALYYYEESSFADLLDCSSYIPHNFYLSNYNLIRFEKF